MFNWHGYGGDMTWILWILIILALVWFVAFATRRGDTSPEIHKTALEISKERYTREEIDRDEFEQKHKDSKS